MWLVHSFVALSCCANVDGAGFAVCGGECVVRNAVRVAFVHGAAWQL